MFICGSNFIGGINACAITPTNVNPINYVQLQYGLYDALYITKNVDFEITSKCPPDWDFDTILYAKFNNSLNAGNVEWNLNNISDIIIKKRESNEFRWITVKTKPAGDLSDVNIYFDDHIVASGGTYEYAVVPVLYGSEGIYSSTSATIDFDKMFIVEDDEVFGTFMTDGYCNTTRNIPSSNVELLNSKYPIFIRNGMANYDTGECSGNFMPEDLENCTELDFSKEGDYARVRYQKMFMDFICDGCPKVLKLPDGRIWLVQVTPNPTDTANDSYNLRYISFTWVEVGGINIESDLYYLGFSDVEEQWWNK